MGRSHFLRSFLTVWAATLAGGALADDRRAACDASDPGAHARVLQADPQGPTDARAVWLDRQRLRWAMDAAALVLDTPDGRVPLQRDGDSWRLTDADPARLRSWHRGPLTVVALDAQGAERARTRVQHALALDDLYAAAASDPRPLGATPSARGTAFHLWAPTARAVALCLYASDRTPARAVHDLQRDDATGLWSATLPSDERGAYYTYLVDVWVPGVGLVRQRVTDPYAISLGADSRRAWIGRLDDPALMPHGWARAPRLKPLSAQTDLVVYELHVRDFSISDASVPAADQGRYAAFTHAGSHGMRHLRALAQAGLTDVHLLPVFDLASVPEQGCSTPIVPEAAPDSLAQQAAVMAGAARDCFNWGYDPLHFNAPEGSYASRADDGAARIREFRAMVMALNRAGLRVGMDMVYNHTSASGQDVRSVLDRIVPGYYQRLDDAGRVATSTCCANTATEHAMMGRLLLDSVRLWAREYRIDSFRFDLMGHQPRAVMERLRTLLRQDRGHEVPLIGEGWNFGEVADGARFVQASQLSLGGSGIATFSDRGRDALRGGGHGDDGAALVARKGWLSGADDPAIAAQVRLALAGTLRSVSVPQVDGGTVRGDALRYGNQMAGYAEQPVEVVNYVENHDNQTLWDLLAFKLPIGTPATERAQAQALGLAFTALAQGVAYFHAGVDLLRSKSMDVNSYDSGDWFNRIDWTARTNHFGTGLPPAGDNGKLHELMVPRLHDPSAQPVPADIRRTRQAMRDWLEVRASTALLRLTTADAVRERLGFLGRDNRLIAVQLRGDGLPGARWRTLVYALNADSQPRRVQLDATERGTLAKGGWRLHPVLARPGAADTRLRQQARFDAAEGVIELPPRSAAVWVR